MKIVKKLASLLTVSAMFIGMAEFVPCSDTEAATAVTINLSKEYQTIRGFGGMNHPEWIGDLTDSQRQTAFGNGDNELGLSVLRVFVNPDSSQWSKAVPTAKYASEHGVTVFATPWEPPASLAESGGSNGKLHLPKSNYGAYAKHLNDFGTYMKNNGVDLYSISVQNEPDFASDWTYWSTDETTDFLANYGDQITSTRLMSPESFQYSPVGASWINGGDGGKTYYNKILANAKAMANCDLFGTHMYGTQRDWMDFPALENSGKEIWMTEVYTPNSEADSNMRWPESLQTSENIHNALVVGNMSVYTWWYIRRNYGPMNEDGSISKRGYCMAQYSKFVRPGDVRVDATEQPADDVYVSAYKGDDNQVTIVAVNMSSTGYAQGFNLEGCEISDVDRYRTSENENLAPTLDMDYSDSGFFAQLPANSVSTFVVTLAGGNTGNTGDNNTGNTGDNNTGNNDTVEPNEYGWYFADGFEGDTCDWSGRGADVTLSGRTAYVGSESLLVQNRTSTWNGATKALNPKAFIAGNEYSFSTNVMYYDGENTEKFYLKLQYTDTNGDTRYSTIAEGTAVKGEWVQLANTNYKIPDGATDMQIYVETAESTNNFYIDEAIGAAAGVTILGAGDSKPFTLGDINSDGKIDSFDVCLAKKAYINKEYSLAADVNQNGTFEIADVVQLHEYVIGKINAFVKDETVQQVNPTEYMQSVKNSVSEYAQSGITEQKSGVDYGTLQKYTYYSTTRERMTNVNVLLPAGYNENEKYPVLYALHGYWENEDTLMKMGAVQNMLGNLVSSGEAEKMIVVFPYIYTSKTQETCSGLDLANSLNYDNFINDLTTDLMPYIEKNFSVKTGRDNTAITGFSMGGRESLFIGMTRSDLFGYVGATCPAPGLTPGTDLSMHPGQIQESELKPHKDNPYLIFITGGTSDSVVYTQPSTYSNILNTNGIEHIYHSVTGGGHDASSVQPHFYNYLRAIFKAK